MSVAHQLMPDRLCHSNKRHVALCRGPKQLCTPLNNLSVQGAKYTQDSYRFAADAFHQQWLSAHPEIKAAVHMARQVRS